MAKKLEGYEPLLIRGGKGSLWLGEDHLLMIESQTLLVSYKEIYRRLDYKNIQAVVHGKSRRGTWQTAMLTLVLVFFGWLTVMTASDSLGGFLLGMMIFFIALFLTLLIAHLIRGPSAGLVVQTAVKAWNVPMVTRRSHADKVMQALVPLCEKAQSGVEEQAAADAVAATNAGVKPRPAPEAPALAGAEGKDVPIHGLAVPGWVCLMIFAVMVAGELAWNAFGATLLMMGFGIAALVLLMICFGRGGGVRATGGRGVFTAAIVTLSLNVVVGYIIGLTGFFTNPQYYVGSSEFDSAPTQYESQSFMFRQISEFPSGYPEGLAVFVGLLAFATGVSALMGLLAAAQQGKRIHQEEYTADDPAE